MNNKLVTSLELSKELKELGVEQKSEFWWVESTEGAGDYKVQCESCSYEYGNNNVYSAYLSGELLTLITRNVKLNSKDITPDYLAKIVIKEYEK